MRSVMAGVSSVMCSYSRSYNKIAVTGYSFDIDLVNDSYACNNDKLLNDILKREFGFQGCKLSFK